MVNTNVLILILFEKREEQHHLDELSEEYPVTSSVDITAEQTNALRAFDYYSTTIRSSYKINNVNICIFTIFKSNIMNYKISNCIKS